MTNRVIIAEDECWAFGLRKNVQGENVLFHRCFPVEMQCSGFRSLKGRTAHRLSQKLTGKAVNCLYVKHCNVCFTLGKTYFCPE